MTKAIHFICRPNVQGQPSNVTFEDLEKAFWSGYWDISEEEAKALVGGWIYLHPAKREPSYYGGQISDWRKVKRQDVAHEDRIALRFRPAVQAKGQKWRGHDHPRSWTSGLLDADLVHEISARHC